MSVDTALDILDDAVADRLDQIGSERVCSAIQAVVWQRGDTLVDAALGQTRLDDLGRPMQPDTPMDLASLTKPLVVSTLMMQAVDEGRARFSDQISAHLPDWADGAKRRGEATLLDLLNHSSGLPAWGAFF
ncbi:MAG: serine hydrolase domain-containing protein, partial [Persicimonas sp.]